MYWEALFTLQQRNSELKLKQQIELLFVSALDSIEFLMILLL